LGRFSSQSLDRKAPPGSRACVKEKTRALSVYAASFADKGEEPGPPEE